MHVTTLDHRMLDRDIIIDPAAIQVARALDGHTLSNPHRVLIAAGHQHAAGRDEAVNLLRHLACQPELCIIPLF